MVKDWNYPSFLLENGVYLPLPTPPLNQGLDSSAYPTCVASNCSASSSSQGNLPGIKEIPDSSQLEFLRLLLFLGCCWVSPALCCVTADKAKARQRQCVTATGFYPCPNPPWRGSQWNSRLYKPDGRRGSCCEEPNSTGDGMIE